MAAQQKKSPPKKGKEEPRDQEENAPQEAKMVKVDIVEISTPVPDAKKDGDKEQQPDNPKDQEPARQEDSSSWDNESEKGSDKKTTKIILVGILVVLLIATLCVGGLIIYQEGVKKGAEITKEQLAVLNPSPTPEPTQTPVVTDDMSLYSITVLNGSGRAGEAAKVKALLEDKEFTVDSIGNADASDYDETVIRAAKRTKDSFIQKLRVALESSYVVASKVEELKEEDEDIIIVVGHTRTE